MRLLLPLLFVLAACAPDGAADSPAAPEATTPAAPAAAPEAPASPAPADTAVFFDAAQRRAAETEARLNDLRAVEGTWVRGAASSTFTAYFDGPALVHLRETMSAGDHGNAEYAFFFQGDSLDFYRERGRFVGVDRERARSLDAVRLDLAFGPDGGLVGWRRHVNGNLRPLLGHEPDNARLHARALRERVPAGGAP